jgi:hypothetical protein
VPAALGGDAPGDILKLRLERLSASSIKMTIELNGHRYERTDATAEYQPMKVDVFAIQFPNGRPYDYVRFGVVEAEGVREVISTLPEKRRRPLMNEQSHAFAPKTTSDGNARTQ